MAATQPDQRLKGTRILGDHRTRLAAELRERYVGGESIRSIADGVGRSYGFVQGLLKESGVILRGRGGDTRNRRVQPERGAVPDDR